MSMMRTQPRGRARLCPDLAASWRGIGYVFGQSREDVFGAGPDLNLLNGAGLADSCLGYGRKFNGSNQYATALPPAGAIDLTKPFTIVTAFVLDSLTTSRVFNYKDPVTAHNTMLMFGAAQRLTFLHQATTGSIGGKAFGNDVLEIGKPYQVVITWDGSSAGYAMYINGLSQNGAATGSVSVSGATPTINLARRSDGSGYMAGQMAMFMHIAGVVDNPASLSANPWQMFADGDDDLDFTAQASATLPVAPVVLSLAGGGVGLRLARRVSVQPAASAIAQGGVALKVARKFAIAPPAPLVLGSGEVRMRVSRRLAVTPTRMDLAFGAVRALVRRRLMVSPANLVLGGGGITLRFTAVAPPLDIAKVHPSRIVMFEGSGSRVVIFEGSGSRVVVFEGSGKRMRFNDMSAKVPTKVGEKWTTDRDRDEVSYYAADITDELADRNTTADEDTVTALTYGVEILEGPQVQVAEVGGVERTFVVVKLGDVDGPLPDDWRWVVRVPCANGERFDKTTWFNEVDP